MTRAAVLVQPGRPLEITQVDVGPPRTGEVGVRLVASGVCHTDHTLANARPAPALPIVLGHEGAGVVTEVGPGVAGIAVGDHVVISAMPQCGECFFCRRGQRNLCDMWTATPFGCQPDGSTRLRRGDQPVYQLSSAGTFAEETVVPAVSAVIIDPAMPLDVAALIGCAVVTGYGAAIRVANIEPDDVVVVVGAGGVGLNAVQGARLAGARDIIAIDTVDWKLDLAHRFGATRTVHVPSSDATAAVGEVTGGRGADVVIEAAGTNETVLIAMGLARAGGHVVAVGAPPRGTTLEIPFRDVVVTPARTISGCIYGSADVRHDFAELVSLYQRGELLLDELVTKRIALEQVNDAFDDLQNGRVARSVIVYDGAGAA